MTKTTTYTATCPAGTVRTKNSTRPIEYVVFIELESGKWGEIIWVKSLDRAKRELSGRKQRIEIRRVNRAA